MTESMTEIITEKISSRRDNDKDKEEVQCMGRQQVSCDLGKGIFLLLSLLLAPEAVLIN